ncbi:MAG: DUF1501 domain-containing protein [Planctomycetota bacterium]
MKRNRQCDGVTRRDAIRIGAIGSAAGLTMGGFLRMADAGMVNDQATAKSAIFVELPGGPSHIDTFDPKPDAGSEFRGTFDPIETNVSGIRISEHLPKMAQQADKFAILRGVSHTLGAHPLGQKFVFTGNRPTPSIEYPGFGSVAARELESPSDLPPYVAIPRTGRGPGYLGVRYAPLSTNGTPQPDQPFNVRGISLGGGLTIEQIERRRGLLQDLDTKFRDIQENDELLSGLDQFSQQAFNMITSTSARNAFDVSKERASYREMFGGDGFSQSCLLATRLIESGVRFVTITLSGWDTHQNNFSRLKDDLLPKLDSGLAGLFAGLAAKGLLDTTAVYVTGEFGRTPKINSRSAEGGRDHYPRCMFMLMGGGGMNGGQVIGESDENASGPKHEAIKPEDAAASFLHAIGIDPHKEYETSIGRPIMIVRDGEKIPQLFS